MGKSTICTKDLAVEGNSATEGDESGAAFPLDRLLHAWSGKITGAISPASLYLAFTDWLVHLGMNPGHQAYLVEKALKKYMRYALYATRYMTDESKCPCIVPLPQDNRFSADTWQNPPFNFIYQGFLLHQQWWYNATAGVHGVNKHHEQVVSFVARQILDILAPSNFLLTNPELMRVTMEEHGNNLWRGMMHAYEDLESALAGREPLGMDEYKIGKNLGITPGKIIYRNELMELIQYTPTTKEVYAEPVLITPAWIMKYYILDLSPENSLVKYLVDKGHTVFMISWKNPTAKLRDFGLDEYRRLGLMEAIEAVRNIVPGQKIHAVGYCLGGTLLAITSAALARQKDQCLKTVTLFAAQTDFEEAGELLLFIDESQVSYLEDMMWDQGYLDKKQMAGAFQLLRSNDLIWSRLQHNYLLGERQKLNDLMAWNADATRMPYKMHSEYLRTLFLNNDFAEGRLHVEGKAVTPANIRAPIFVVATTRDHVSPWKSVYKIHLFADTTITFVLTSGGHNAGIVSEPGHPHREFQIYTTAKDAGYISPERWQEKTPVQEGSWWPAWQEWLVNESTQKKVSPPTLGHKEKGDDVLCDAPGTYVFEQ